MAETFRFMIAIIDYDLGDLLSVKNAFAQVSGERNVVVTKSPELLEQASHIILPGVGSFKNGTQNLIRLNLVDALNHQIRVKKKPFLRIC